MMECFAVAFDVRAIVLDSPASSCPAKEMRGMKVSFDAAVRV